MGEYVKCAFGVPRATPCDLGLVYQDSIHACNYPDQLIEELGCNPSALLGGFTCPAPEDLDPLARRFFPFPRFAVQGRNDLYIICVTCQDCKHVELDQHSILQLYHVLKFSKILS